MKIRVALAAAVLVLAAASSQALSFELIDWFNGPVQFIMSKDEIGIWRSLKSDDEARAFIDLFWARRDPTPDTPRNEAREQFDARVAWADKNLTDGSKKRGALTDRGKILILYGQPKRIERSTPDKSWGRDVREGALQKDERVSDNWMQWIYEAEEGVKDVFLVPKAVIRFVDRMGNEEFRVERGAVDLVAAQQRAIQRSILHPDLNTPPKYAAASATAQTPAAEPVAPAPPAIPTTLSNPALAAAVAEFKAKAPADKTAHVTWGEFVTSYGQYFVPVMLSVPKSSGLAADQQVTFFGVVEDESGKSVLAFEEPLKLHAAKDELFADKSLTLGAGKHRGVFGLAVDGKPVAIGSADMTLAGALDKDATAISGLILSNFIQPMAVAQAPTEPYAFGGVKVVPKPDKTFRPSDELWYFFELRNPGLAEAIAPTEGTATGAPAEQKPKVQIKVDVEGKDAQGNAFPKRSAPPREVEAVPMKGVPGHYGIGNAIPLESFKPGDYTFTMKVIDTVKKQSYTLTDTFKIIN